MIRSVFTHLLFFLFYITTATAQSSRLFDTWEGDFTMNGATEYENIIKKIRLKITGSQTVEFSILNESSNTYVSYKNDPEYKNWNISQTFSSSGTSAYMNLLKENKTSATNSQELFNFIYDKNYGSLVFTWCNISSPFIKNSNLFGYGELFNKNNVVYSGNNLLVGGQSFDYIKIESINRHNDATLVTFVFTNKTDKKISGTVNEAGHLSAFYITNADRSKKYQLKKADIDLPYKLEVAPGSSKKITLFFDPIPSDMKLMNIFEGGPADATNLWKFYDVRLKD